MKVGVSAGKRLMTRSLIAGIAVAVALASCQGSQRSDRLVYGLSQVPESLDPVALQDKEAALVATQIFEGLVEFLPDEPGVVNCLADRWEISPDQRSYFFFLRPDVRFHDGTSLDAKAVAFSLLRTLHSYRPRRKLEAPTAATFLEKIRSIEALNPETVRIQLKEPYSPLLKDLARPCCAIVSPAAVEQGEEPFGQNPVGTGAFRYAVSENEDTLTLQRWDQYWREKPRVSGLEFRAIPEEPKRLAALSAGEIDITDIYAPDTLAQAEGEGRIEVRKTIGVGLVALLMNTSQEPFSLLPVRQAIAHAVNKKGLVSDLVPGCAEVAHGVLAPSMWGFRVRTEAFPHDPGKAKGLLDEAGYGSGFRARLTAPETSSPLLPKVREVSEALRNDLQAVGIQVELDILEKETVEQRLESGSFELCLWALESPNGDADGFLAAFVTDSATGAKSADPVAANLLTLVRSTTDGEKREAYYAQLDETILRSVPSVFLWHPYRLAATGDRVSRFTPHTTGLHKLRTVTLR